MTVVPDDHHEWQNLDDYFFAKRMWTLWANPRRVSPHADAQRAIAALVHLQAHLSKLQRPPTRCAQKDTGIELMERQQRVERKPEPTPA